MGLGWQDGVAPAVITSDLKDHPPLARAAADVQVSGDRHVDDPLARARRRARRPPQHRRDHARHRELSHHPEQAAQIANAAHVKLLVFYHLLPSPGTFLTRVLFSHGVNAIRRDGLQIANDGSLYTLPRGSNEVRIGRIAR